MRPDKAIADFIADRPLLALGPEDRVASAVAVMKEHGSDCVLVCESGALRGIFTQRDFLNRVAVVGRSDGPLGEVMTADPHALRETDGIMSALHRMAVGNYRNVPIVDESGRARANLSVWDVMRHLADIFASGKDAASDSDLAAVGKEPLTALSPPPSVEVEASDQLLSILSLMLQRACGAVRVNDGDDLVGIFAERDLMVRVDYSSTAWHATPVSAVMTADPVCIDRRTSIADALAQMNEHGFRHLPVIRDAGEETAMLVSVREILSFVASRDRSRG